jgi:metal-dependent amidase/aminoacylase/carboxypeptidase family protein
MLKTVRLDHLKAALLAAAAELLAAAGLVVLYAQPAEANYPGKPGKIASAGNDGNDLEIFTINPTVGTSSQSPTTVHPTTFLPTRLRARG